MHKFRTMESLSATSKVSYAPYDGCDACLSQRKEKYS